MSAGTKVFLAIIGLLVGGLVLYYTALSDDEDRPLRVEKRAEPARAPDPLTTPARRQTPPPTAWRPASPSASPVGPLGETIARAADPAAVTPIRDRPPVAGAEPPAAEARPSTGTMLAAPGRIPVPVRPPATTAGPERHKPIDHTDYFVKPGDTMSSIAAGWFGDAHKWDLIARANPLVDPNRLQPGDLLRLPSREAARPTRNTERPSVTPAATGETYTVRSGDTLSAISQSFYGTTNAWRRIYDANRATIGADPHRLEVGMRLTIPR